MRLADSLRRWRVLGPRLAASEPRIFRALLRAVERHLADTDTAPQTEPIEPAAEQVVEWLDTHSHQDLAMQVAVATDPNPESRRAAANEVARRFHSNA